MYKLLTHNDLDGIGCGILAKLAFGEQVHVRYNSIGSLDREVEHFLENGDKETFLMITDLSVSEDNKQRLDDYYQKGGKVKLLDHHKSALSFNEYEWGEVSVTDKDGKMTSATSLFYEYLIKNKWFTPNSVISEFVELVRQYDTWEWEKNNNLQAKRLNTLFFLVSMDVFEETMISRLKSSDHFHFDEFENQLLNLEEENIERYIRRKSRQLVQKKVNGYYAGVVYAESYHSELGNELGKEHPHLDYIIILNIGARRIGFRTIHDHVDVSEIAGHYGGGGHEKAAGATMTEEAFNQFVKATFKLEPLREDAKRNRYNIKESSFGTLFKNREDHLFLIFQDDSNNWVIEKNKKKMDGEFSSFDDAERHLKRNFEAWLEKDNGFVSYLMDELRQDRK